MEWHKIDLSQKGVFPRKTAAAAPVAANIKKWKNLITI